MNERLHGLDALRGIAALVVLVFHICLIYGLEPLFVHGWLAVDFFFALSGYVLARTYEGRLHSKISPWMFAKKRFLRFWPVVLFGGAVGAPYVLAGFPAQEALAILALNLFLIPYFRDGELFPLNGPYWSLFYELAANIAHGFLLSRLSDRQLLALVAACALGLAIIGYFYGGLSLGTNPKTFAAGFVRVTLSYGLSVLLYRWWRDEPPIKIRWPALVLVGVLLLIGRGPLAGFLPQLAFVLICVPLVIAGGLRWQTKLSPLGTLSFPLYAAHLPVVYYCKIMGLPPLAGGLTAVAVASAYVGLDQWQKRPTSAKA